MLSTLRACYQDININFDIVLLTNKDKVNCLDRSLDRDLKLVLIQLDEDWPIACELPIEMHLW
jgi:hypothetical protein